jgi:hypothetical protein
MVIIIVPIRMEHENVRKFTENKMVKNQNSLKLFPISFTRYFICNIHTTTNTGCRNEKKNKIKKQNLTELKLNVSLPNMTSFLYYILYLCNNFKLKTIFNVII